MLNEPALIVHLRARILICASTKYNHGTILSVVNIKA